MKLLPKLAVWILFSTLIISCQKDPNKVPTADAGTNQFINSSATIFTLSGSGTDEDGSVVAYLWSQVVGPNTATIVNPGSQSTEVTGFVTGTYRFQLMVTDNEGATGVDTVTYTIFGGGTSNPQTITLQPASNPNEKMLIKIGSQDHSAVGGNEWIVDAWTVGGQTFIGRSLFKFDLSAIPTNANILAANLFLYSNTPPENGNLVDANFGTDNGLYLQRVTSDWTANTANWNSQPQVSTADQITVPSTTQAVLDLNIDVKNQISSMLGTNNKGFILRLQNESAMRSRAFVSSYHQAKPDKRPKLVVTYQ